MINSSALLNDLRRVLRALEVDLRTRIDEQASLSEGLQAEWKNARDVGRTGVTYTEWLDDEITQAAVHWVLGCVYLRFLEDNHYLERPYLAGPVQERIALARDRHEEYFRAHPTESDREYLLSCFRDVAQLPGMRGLFDERHNPVFRIGLSGDGAMQLLGFWQKINPDTGLLIHDFHDPESATRFLGDLYQDLSESARKRYALLQTPVFVEEFILDRTLTPAIDEFGYREVRLIDPTCGSGHFVLGAFQRLFDLWARNEPARNLGDIVQKALDGVYGVDLNPYAVAIARFRLLIAALKACGVTRLKDAPAFRINLAVGDSLLHGRRFKQLDLGGEAENLVRRGLAHAYQIEDFDEVNRILDQRYHVVVGNPPYITVKDSTLNAAYRSRYATCHRAYSLGVPFTERFFELTISTDNQQPAGFVGMITANSFMKREFGSRLIEVFLPQVDLTHVIDTAGAYIPGHGTPTVILLGRNRRPVGDKVRTVMCIKGEPSTPDNPAHGVVWLTITRSVDQPGQANEFVSTEDVPRRVLAMHPWTLGGGDAISLLELMKGNSYQTISKLGAKIGAVALTRYDDAYVIGLGAIRRLGLATTNAREYIAGEDVRDWSVTPQSDAIWPYRADGSSLEDAGSIAKVMWPFRSQLARRVAFGKTQLERGRPWFEYSMLFPDRYNAKDAITFSNVATHNHFVFVRGGRIYNAHAPLIVLATTCRDEDYLGLVGLLNSSAACFWMKQVFHNKGSTVDSKGARQRTDAFEDFFEFTGTGLGDFPVPRATDFPIDISRRLNELARELAASLPAALLNTPSPPTRALLDGARENVEHLRKTMIAFQEELDWRTYRSYGLVESLLEYDAPPNVELGQRAFEIVLARRMRDGEETTWFTRHSSTPTAEMPGHWPGRYREIVERRIRLIESNEYISLIERPEYKRRWNLEPWLELEQRALRGWLLDRLEDPRYWHGEPQLKSIVKLADAAREDPEFMQIAELFAGRSDFDIGMFLADLVQSEAVPFLPGLRYTESGLRKRVEWELCWHMQRHEDQIDAEVDAHSTDRRAALVAVVRGQNPKPKLDDAESEWIDTRLRSELSDEKARRRGEEVGDIPMPQKYKSADFQSSIYWRLRGGLDVPKERFVSFAHCSRDSDGSLVIAWAGWTHLQQATALGTYYLSMKENEGWLPDRLKPLLAGIQELVPWLKQWHNDYTPEHATRMGDYFESFVVDEARALGFTLADLNAWTPPAKTTAGRGRKKKEAVS